MDDIKIPVPYNHYEYTLEDKIELARSALATLAGTNPATLHRAVEDVARMVEQLSVTGVEIEKENARINAERAALVQQLERLQETADTLATYARVMLEDPSLDPKARKQWSTDLRALYSRAFRDDEL